MGERADLDQALAGWDDPQSVLRRIARGALNLTGAAEGASIQLLDAEGNLVVVCLEGSPVQPPSMRLPPVGSLSGLAVSSQTAQRCDETERDARVDREACRRLGARSLVCVPLVRAGAPIGVLSVLSGRPGAFDDEVVETLSELAGFVSVLVGTLVHSADTARERPPVGAAANGSRLKPSGGAGPAGSAQARRVAAFVSEIVDPGLADRAAARHRVELVLDERALSLMYQPIVNLTRRTTVAVEALARFPGPSVRPPDMWFAEAHAVGLGVELELLAVEEALVTLRRLPPNVVLGVNASPMAVASRELRRMLAAVDAKRVAIEITEHVAVDDYAALGAHLRSLRELGARVSIDDTGAGYASLRHILALSPDYIKLDLALTRDIDTDPARRALAGALVSFVSESGSRLIAEGIETASELATVRALGIPYGQGYYLGRPMPFDHLELVGSRHLGPPRLRPAAARL